MDSNLAIVLAALIGALSGLSGTFLVHIATKKKEKKGLLRDKAEELFRITNKIVITIFDRNYSRERNLRDLASELEVNRARMIVQFYFPELYNEYDKFFGSYLKYLGAIIDDEENKDTESENVESEDISKAKDKLIICNNEFIEALVKRFNKEELNV